VIEGGLNFEGAWLYGLPWYYILPLVTAALLLALSRRVAARVARAYPGRLAAAWSVYLPLAVVFSLGMASLDDLSTGTLFLVALIFYGLMVMNPVLDLVLAFRRRGPRGRRLGAVFNICLLALAAYSFFVEPYRIEVTFHRLVLPGAPALRLVQISDIQAERWTGREEAAVEIVSGLSPDLIVVTGDYYTGLLSYQAPGAAAARRLLASLRAPLGVYAVSGSSNPAAEDPELLRGTGVEYLSNRSAVVNRDGGKLVVAGLDYVAPDLDRALAGVSTDLPIVLLYHSPAFGFDPRGGPHGWTEALPRLFSPPPPPNPRLKARGVDLLLTGHTHGGQVRFPLVGAVMTGTRLGSRFTRGWHDVGGCRLYINRGLGMDGRFAPKIRFLSRPEIAVFDINTAAPAGTGGGAETELKAVAGRPPNR